MLLIMRREDVHTSSRHVHRVWCLASCIAGLTLWHGVFVEVVLVMCTDAVRFCVIKMFMLVPPHTFFFFSTSLCLTWSSQFNKSTPLGAVSPFACKQFAQTLVSLILGIDSKLFKAKLHLTLNNFLISKNSL